MKRSEPIFLTPAFQERIWGGDKLRKVFDYNIPSNKTGECWAISAHAHGQSVVSGGKFAQMTLSELYKQEPALFGNPKTEQFPLLVKILDADCDLSVQVHPNDTYAHEHENGSLGKTECWYIIDCNEGAEIILGHNAKTKEELKGQIASGNWENLLQRKKIKPGDFFFVPSGVVHAICAGTLILETQQSSDVTYRLYDYDRLDDQGNKRELHLDEAIAVTSTPSPNLENKFSTVEVEGGEIIELVNSEYFQVQKWNIKTKITFPKTNKYLLVSVISGKGKIEMCEKTYALKKGIHFIIPAHTPNFSILGEMECIVTRC